MPIALAILSLLIAASRSNAQSSACGAGTTTLTLAAGVGQSDRVDATASPFQFRGRGLELSAVLAHAAGRVCVTADAVGGAKLLSTSERTAATERLVEADAGIAVLHATAIRSIAIGGEARGLLAVTEHAYEDPRHIVASYRVGALSLGPAVRWTRRIGGGEAAMQLSSTVIALVDHPYVAVWTDDAEPSFRVVSPTQYRAVHAGFSYAWTTWRGVASTLSYRMSGLRYDDVHPLRALSQSLTVGARLPFAP